MNERSRGWSRGNGLSYSVGFCRSMWQDHTKAVYFGHGLWSIWFDWGDSRSRWNRRNI